MHKNPKSVVRERPKRSNAVRTKNKPAKSTRPARQKTAAAPKSSARLTLTNVDKIMFPESGLTKGDLLDYYQQIAPLMLPHIKDRPLTLERLPNGLVGKSPAHFWQKNTPDYYPSWIKRISLPTLQDRNVQYVLANDSDSLLYLVNQGCITFHIYESHVGSLQKPDFVLFDLDPVNGGFADAIKVAKTLREFLDDANAKAFIKTSGKRGLHIFSPWKQKGGYDEARAWALKIARRVIDRLPQIATLERSIAGRKGKLYLDVIQNALGHHVVAPYTIRATPSATVSTPLDWDELTAKLNPEKFTPAQVLQRAKREGDPWKNVLRA